MLAITIGRHTKNDIIIEDPDVSLFHLQLIQYEDGSCSVKDLDSENGTYLNNCLFRGDEVALMSGDEVRIKDYVIPWESYFQPAPPTPPRPEKSPKLFLILFGFICVALAIMLPILLKGNGQELGRNFGYDTEIVNTQVLISFSDDISSLTAYSWLNNHEAQVIETNAEFNYFLVCTKDEYAANQLVSMAANGLGLIDCAIRNRYIDPQSVKLSVVDVFDEPMSKTEKFSHGQMVRYTMEHGTDIEAKIFEERIDGKISYKEINSDIMNICQQMSNNDLNLINVSLSTSPYKDKKNKIKFTRDEFIENYAEELRWYANLAYKCKQPNFIITKGIGNESEYRIEDAFELALEKMNENQREALKNHIILVASKDTRKGLDHGYSNKISRKIDGVNTIMVDLSELPRAQRGTSAASPLMANWIAKADFQNAGDVIETIDKVTKYGELVSEDVFRETAKEVIRQNESRTSQTTYTPPKPAGNASFTTANLNGLYAVVYEGETLCYFDFNGKGNFNQKVYWHGRPGMVTRSYGYEIRNGNELYTYLKSSYSDNEFEYYGTLSIKNGRLFVEMDGEAIEFVKQ